MTFDDLARREKTVSGIAAVVMHLLFFALLVFGVSWQKREPDSAMVVDLWSSLPAPPRAETPRPQPKPEPEPPKPEPRPEPKPAPPPPKPEPKPTVKPDIALKEKQAKRKLKEEQEKLEREKKLKQEQARREKELAERKQREEKLLAEKKQKDLAEKKQREKELAEKKLKEQKEAEAKRAAAEQADAQRKLAAAQAAASQKMIDEYRRRISEKIKRYIVEPPNLNPKAEVEFDIVVIPGGEVLSAKLKRSSNSIPAYDSAVERAIMRAQPLPLPPDPALASQFRELNLVFKPGT